MNSPLVKPLALVLSVSAGTFLVVCGYVQSLRDTARVEMLEASSTISAPPCASSTDAPAWETAPDPEGKPRCSPCPLDLSWGSARVRGAARGT